MTTSDVGLRPIGEVAEGLAEDVAARGQAGPAALVAAICMALVDQLKRKGYDRAGVTADYVTDTGLWRIMVTADLTPSLFRRYVTEQFDVAIAAAEEWAKHLPEKHS